MREVVKENSLFIQRKVAVVEIDDQRTDSLPPAVVHTAVLAFLYDIAVTEAKLRKHGKESAQYAALPPEAKALIKIQVY